MLHGDRLLMFHNLGFDIGEYNYDELVDKLLENYKKLLDEKYILQKDLFSQTLYSVSTIRKN